MRGEVCREGCAGVQVCGEGRVWRRARTLMSSGRKGRSCGGRREGRESRHCRCSLRRCSTSASSWISKGCEKLRNTLWASWEKSARTTLEEGAVTRTKGSGRLPLASIDCACDWLRRTRLLKAIWCRSKSSRSFRFFVSRLLSSSRCCCARADRRGDERLSPSPSCLARQWSRAPSP